MTQPTPSPKGPSARALVVGLLLIGAMAALLPVVVARTRRVQSMRSDLREVMSECRARYAGSLTAADTAAADVWQPPLHGQQRAGDPGCGAYRRRNMLTAGGQ